MAALVIVGSLGAAPLAAHQIVTHANSLAVLPARGLAAAATALVGQNVGRRDPTTARHAGLLAGGLAAAAMVGVGGVLAIFPEAVTGLFTAAPSIAELSNPTIRLLALGMPLAGASMVLAGGLRGAGDTAWLLRTAGTGHWLLHVGVGYLLAVPLGWGLRGIWAALIAFFLYSTAINAWRMAGERWRVAASG